MMDDQDRLSATEAKGGVTLRDEASRLRDRIRRLREAIRMVGRGGLDFVERYTPHYKRGAVRPDSLPLPSAQAWVDEVLAKDDAEAVRE